MNITVVRSREDSFINCECIKGFAFDLALFKDTCARLPHICAGSGRSQDNCTLFSRNGRLSPRNRFS